MDEDQRPLGVALAVVVLVEVSVSVLVPGEDSLVDECSLVVLLLLELAPPPAGEGFTIVVLLSDLVPGDAAGAVVSTLCSHDARSAALAMMQMYFVIV